MGQVAELGSDAEVQTLLGPVSLRRSQAPSVGAAVGLLALTCSLRPAQVPPLALLVSGSSWCSP